MKNSFTRINFNNFYITNEINQVVEYAKKHSNVKGVSSAFNQIQNVKNDYLQEMQKLIEDESNYENKIYTHFKMIHLCKIVSRLVVIVAFISFFFQGKLPENFFGSLLMSFSYLLFTGGIFVWIITKVLEIIYRKRYMSYMKKTERKFSDVNGGYYTIINGIYDKVDGLYLNSLDPMLRESVLMRRDQQKQHEEMLRVKQKEIENQKIIMQEQLRARQAQEELLEIEREREKRYNRY